jgi:HEAT repeat protein
MEPYWMFLKTVVSTFVSLMGAAAVLFTSGPAPDVSVPRAPTVLRASLGHWTDAAEPGPAQESAGKTETIVIEALIGALKDTDAGAFAQDVAALSARLKANDPSERGRAACEIKKLGTDAKSLIPQLANMLGDAAAVPGDVCGDWGRWWNGGEHGAPIPETTPGERAAQALVAIGSASFDPVVQALRGPQWHARKNAAWALGAMDDERGVTALIEALKDSDPDTRAQAAWALGAIDDERAVPGLVGALSDEISKVRAQAAWALGAIGDRRAAAALAAAMKDPDAKVRRQAAWALGAIQ